jgi:hypothetical protein
MGLNLQDRDLRQRDLVPPGKLACCAALVVGVGAVGRQVALQLTAMGIMNLTLVDFDTVDVVNLAPQGYAPEDLGNPKGPGDGRIVPSPESDLLVYPIVRQIPPLIAKNFGLLRWSTRLTGEASGGILLC